MSGTTSFRRLACDWWNARSGSGRPLTLRDALDLAEFAHAAGRRAGLEEAAGEAEALAERHDNENDWRRGHGGRIGATMARQALVTLAADLRARGKGE
jgi:hypothetical protein